MSDSAKVQSLLRRIARLRFLVGMLGSKKQFGWWDCSFLDDTGLRFLATTFPRSAPTAALEATVDAAERVHDQALGRVGCYHLFRLPPGVEDRLRSLGLEADSPTDQPAALEELSRLADAAIRAPAGPVQIGVEKRILTETSIQELAAHYHSAFSQGIRCYPYFSADT